MKYATLNIAESLLCNWATLHGHTLTKEPENTSIQLNEDQHFGFDHNDDGTASFYTWGLPDTYEFITHINNEGYGVDIF